MAKFLWELKYQKRKIIFKLQTYLFKKGILVLVFWMEGIVQQIECMELVAPLTSCQTTKSMKFEIEMFNPNPHTDHLKIIHCLGNSSIQGIV